MECLTFLVGRRLNTSKIHRCRSLDETRTTCTHNSERNWLREQDLDCPTKMMPPQGKNIRMIDLPWNTDM
jgi:hypothetical protein